MLPLARSCTPSPTTFPPPEAAFTICELSLTVVDPRSPTAGFTAELLLLHEKFACNRLHRCFRRRVQQSRDSHSPSRPGLRLLLSRHRACTASLCSRRMVPLPGSALRVPQGRIGARIKSKML